MNWLAIYDDGTRVPQIDEAGEHLYKDIEWQRVVAFGWVGAQSYMMPVAPGDEVVAFRRHEANVKEDRVVSYGLGIKGKFLLMIDAQGNVEVRYGSELLSDNTG